MVPHIKQFIPQLLPKTDWKVNLLINWDTIMKNLAQHVQIIKIEEHTLILGVDHSSWMQELYVLSPFLLEKINQHLDNPRIKQLRFKMISQQKNSSVYNKQPGKRSNQEPIHLSQSEQDAISRIKDEELKQCLTHFLQRCRDV